MRVCVCVCDVVNLESAASLLMVSQYSHTVAVPLVESHSLALRLISVQQSVNIELPQHQIEHTFVYL